MWMNKYYLKYIYGRNTLYITYYIYAYITMKRIRVVMYRAY